jgi:hypothetical protein
MKNIIIYMWIAGLLICSPSMAESNLPAEVLEEIESKTLSPYFNALKTGNVQMLKGYFSDEMYAEYRVLLEDNKGYPRTLRNVYKDAIFSIEKGVVSDNGILVEFSIQFPGGSKQIVQYELIQQVRGDQNLERGEAVRWKIKGQHHKSRAK